MNSDFDDEDFDDDVFDEQEDFWDQDDDWTMEDNENPYGSDPEDEAVDNKSKNTETEEQETKTSSAAPSLGSEERKFMATAKSLGYSRKETRLVCPVCKKHSLFYDKPAPTFGRITKSVLLACIGCVDITKDTNVLRFLCFNKRCSAYFPKTGDKFLYNPAMNKLERKKNYFHVNR